MAWVRIDDQFADHPKAAKAGPLGMAMQLAALCHCNRYLTDGFVAQEVAPRLLDFAGLGFDDGTAQDDGPRIAAFAVTWQRVVRKLVATGMWEEVEGGWQLHDFLDYNPSRESVLAKRAADLERKRSPRRDEEDSARNPNGIRSDSKRPVPVPVPVEDLNPNTEETHTPRDGARPSRAAGALPAPHQRRFDAFWAAYPKKTGKKRALSWWARARPDGETADAILAGVAAWAASDQWRRGYVPDPDRWLRDERWGDEVPPEPVAGGARASPNGHGRRAGGWVKPPRELEPGTEEYMALRKGKYEE